MPSEHATARPGGSSAPAVWRLGYPEDPVKPGFMHVRWGPGEGSPEHRHKAWTACVILKGPLRIGEKWHEAGDVIAIEPNIWYGPLEAGPDGAELLEIHASMPGVEPIWRDPNDPGVQALNRWLERTGRAAWKEVELRRGISGGAVAPRPSRSRRAAP